MQANWRPSATIEVLKQRGALVALIRHFFSRRDVLEVDTPVLMPTTATDVYIDSFRVQDSPLFLQTSPEFALKRLLAAGSGAIYQMGKVFRRDAPSRRHNPEFTLLEWYRPGFSLEQLMDEVEALVVEVFAEAAHLAPAGTALASVERLSYRELFQHHLGIDPHRASDADIARLSAEKIDLAAEALSRTDRLQLLLSHCIEPKLPRACFIVDYPVAQAALARIEIDATGEPVARRFELFVDGMELANGYFELQDAAEQRRRFEVDIAERAARGYDAVPLDEDLLAALAHGLPECSGVALGVDRLLMAALKQPTLTSLLTF